MSIIYKLKKVAKLLVNFSFDKEVEVTKNTLI